MGTKEIKPIATRISNQVEVDLGGKRRHEHVMHFLDGQPLKETKSPNDLTG